MPPNYDMHLESARNSINQYQQWKNEFIVPALSMSQLIKTLRLDLYTICQQPIKIEPENFTDALITIASKLMSPSSKAEALELAYAWLDEPSPKIEASLAAFQLCQLPEDHKYLQNLFQKQQELRIPLLQFWKAQNTSLPDTILQQALHDNKTKPTALYYAANEKDVSLSVFQSYYRQLDETQKSCWAPAIFGGVLRNDPLALNTLPAAIVQCDKPEQLLQIVAILGELSLLPALIEYSERKPIEASQLLAIHGHQQAAERVLMLLQQPQYAEAVAPAWYWVTGQTLSQKPIMQVVGDDKNINVPTLPDIQAAKQWWEINVCNWPKDERRIAGQSFTQAMIQQLQSRWAGKAEHYLSFLFRLFHKPSTADTNNARVI